MKKASNGFTIIEILVTITIIGILATIGIVSFSSIQSGSRNTQRSSKITVIAEALEKYYSQNGEYPTCSNGQLVSGATTGTTNVLVVDPNALITPSGNSIVCNAPTSDTFGYVGGGSSYTLEYKDESTGSNVLLNSRHTILTLTAPSAPVTTVSFSSPNVLAAITPVTCQTGAIAQYQINSRTNDGAWAGWSDWSTTAPTASQTANQGVKYGYQAQARCYPNGSPNYTSTTATGSESTYIQPVTAPTMTAVTTPTTGDTTTWSWPAVTCAAGTTANYQYDYTISPATYDSGWVADGTNLSIAFITSTEGQTYTVQVQAQCYNAVTTSGWSGAGSASWYHPITQYTLTTAAGTGGTVSSGGTYNTGTVQTITATPNANYTFSSWSGGTGCSGVASHTITMDANKSCTANFTPTAIGTPTMTAVTTPTTGDTTTWSWSAVSCPGNTARYRYDYLIDGVSQAPAGWKTPTVPTATSINFTTVTEGHTYAVLVQAQCYNAVTSSAWSASSNTASWYHPITQYTLTTAAGTGGTVSSGGTYNTGTVQTITATPNANYTFSSWSGSTGCSGVASHTITMDANKSCTANFTPTAIGTPTMTAVTTPTTGDTTTWSWGAVSCPGNTARYQYRYTISPATYDSGWVADGTNLSIAFTTSTEGQTYTVQVQAQCYNAVTTSGWSVAGSASWYHPITTYVLTTVAGTGGTVSAGGTYNTGTVQTITATPSTNYLFSSWTGSTGCSGVASHTITMDANKSCTANFTIITYTLTIAAGTGGTVNTGGTYNSGTVQTITATPSTYYSFSSWTGSTGCSGVASHTITMDANKSCTANFTPTAIGTPTMTAVTTPTTGDTTTWSWSAVSCPGNTARYRYDYLIDSVSQAPAGWKTPTVPTATSINFTTVTEGHTYAVLVQAQCYNTVTSSAWSASSNTASWYHPITTYVLTTVAGAGGTVSSGGTYNTGSTPTITATPSAGSTFSSWSGSTGCSGVASHTITMDANKSCTANFTIGANWLVIGTQVWAKANLNVGTMVTGVTAQTNNSILEKYCSANLESNCTTYGGFYQWDEAMQYVTTNGAQGICPTGSHIPSDNDFKILEVQLGMTQAQADVTGSWRGTDQGTQLKSGGSSGLNMPLAGYRATDGSFYPLSVVGYLWSSSQSSTSAWDRLLNSGLATVYRTAYAKVGGNSVRCLGN